MRLKKVVFPFLGNLKNDIEECGKKVTAIGREGLDGDCFTSGKKELKLGKETNVLSSAQKGGGESTSRREGIKKN